MDLPDAVAIFIARALASSVVDALMRIAPHCKTSIDALLVRINQGAWLHGVFHEGLDRLLLHIGQQRDHHVPPTFTHPKDWRSFLRQGASTSFAFPSASTTFSTLALDDCGLPFMAGYHLGFVALDFVG
jgi:hypothetical protein